MERLTVSALVDLTITVVIDAITGLVDRLNRVLAAAPSPIDTPLHARAARAFVRQRVGTWSRERRCVFPLINAAITVVVVGVAFFWRRADLGQAEERHPDGVRHLLAARSRIAVLVDATKPTTYARVACLDAVSARAGFRPIARLTRRSAVRHDPHVACSVRLHVPGHVDDDSTVPDTGHVGDRLWPFVVACGEAGQTDRCEDKRT